MIELDRDIPLAVTPAQAWQTLWNISALAACIPGCESVEEVEAKRRYRATLRDRIGPFKVTIPLDVVVDSIVDGSRLSVTASGRDSMLGSPVKIQLTVLLDPAEGGARLTLHGAGEVGGKLAALGQAVTQRKTRDTLDRFAMNLQRLLGESTDAPPV